MPQNNYFGITAASAETPDSFEIFKFVTTAATSFAPPPVQNQIPIPGNSYQKAPPPPAQNPGSATGDQAQANQLADILRTVQAMNQAMDSSNRQAQQINTELQNRILELQGQLAKADQMATLQQKVQAMELALTTLRNEIRDKDYTAHFNDLRAGLNARHEAMLEYLPEKMHNRMSSHFYFASERRPTNEHSDLLASSKHGALHLPCPRFPGWVGRRVCYLQAKACIGTQEVSLINSSMRNMFYRKIKTL